MSLSMADQREGGCVCFSWASHSEAAEACNCYKSQYGSQGKSGLLQINIMHDMEDFYFPIDFHHWMFYWKRKVKLKLRKRNYFDSHHGVLISLCSCSSQIGHPLLPYLGLIHIQAYSQPYLDKIQNVIRGLCHWWCFNQQVLLFLFSEFDTAANVEIKETELFFSLRGNLIQRGESD